MKVVVLIFILTCCWISPGQSQINTWQSVEPAERRSNLVMLPDLPGGRLIGDLSFSSC
jgi:hypothetical protein